MHPEVDRFGAAAGEDNPVEPGELQFGRPEAARLAVADQTGGGAFGGGRTAALPADGTPVVGESMNDSVFSGPSGSAPGGVFLSR